MAIPKAILNTKTVDGFKGTPTHPIMPAVITNGIKLGIKEQSKILKDLNKYNIQTEISKKAQNILCFNPSMMNRLPSRKVMLLPVNLTLY